MERVFDELYPRHAVEEERHIPTKWLRLLEEIRRNHSWVRTLVAECAHDGLVERVVPGDPGRRTSPSAYFHVLWMVLASPSVALDVGEVWLGLVGASYLRLSARLTRAELHRPPPEDLTLEAALWPAGVERALADPVRVWRSLEVAALFRALKEPAPPRAFFLRMAQWSMLYHFLSHRRVQVAEAEPPAVAEVARWLRSLCLRETNPPYFTGATAREFLLGGLAPLGVRAVADADPAREYLLVQNDISSKLRAVLSPEEMMALEERAALRPVPDFDTRMDPLVQQLWLARAWALHQEGAQAPEASDDANEAEELARDHRMATMHFLGVFVTAGSLEAAWGDLEFHTTGCSPLPPLIVQVGHRWLLVDKERALLFGGVAHALFVYHQVMDEREGPGLRPLGRLPAAG